MMVKFAKHYWVCVAPDQEACLETLAEKRRYSIFRLQQMPWREIWGLEWNQLRRKGWRCIKVTIQEAT